MNIRFEKLVLVFNRSTEEIEFSDITYFYGQMGAGKSSIARLIDYCLGDDLDFSPALQSEFVSSTLHLLVNSIPLVLERPRGSNQIHASWKSDESFIDIIVPARDPEDILIPGTEVQVLSDLIFYLCGIQPPKVRRSKLKQDSELGRLSFRDLLWYCYLDQDSFDSSFFHLGEDDHIFKRYKSRDVLRYILGFHQEQVAEYEAQVQLLQIRRMQYIEAASSLKDALADADVASEEEIISKIDSLKRNASIIQQQLSTLRSQRFKIPHGTDVLRDKGRNLTYEIEALDNAIPEVEKAIDQDRRHKNEIFMLGIKIHRVAAARAVLSGVSFESCPRCAQKLPDRDQNLCTVCGQIEPVEGTANLSSEVIEQDAKSRIQELEESIALHQEQLNRMKRRRNDLVQEKINIDNELTAKMQDYDSAYLSNAIVLEREQAQILEQVSSLERLIKLPQKVRELYKLADETLAEQAEIKRKLDEARKGAEADITNVKKLEELFLDCLLRSKLAGFSENDKVHISYKDFLPVVTQPETEELVVTSFANLISGGKKTLFKACFALALHRLSVDIGAYLPTFLIIDSPMKNISERENMEQFVGFHDLVYDLAAGELSQTQFILIDKEYLTPDEALNLNVKVRHMMPNSDEFPPLIPYHKIL